jgi:hypothetical protein
MSITTNIVATGHSSTTIVNLLNPKVKTSYVKRSETIDQPDIYDPAIVESENAFLRLIQFFKTSNITNAIFYRFVPTGNLAYKDRLVLQFSLTKQYTSYFPLLRGLFGFGKLAGLSVSTNALSKTFEVEIHSGSTERVLPYLETIFSELLKEVKFKIALKKVILVQQEVAKIQQESLDRVYGSLN